MTRPVEWRPRATKDLEKLERPLRERIVSAIERLVESGEGDVRRLAASDPPEFRLRVGDWRVLFRSESAARTIVIIRVLPRDKAYR